MPLSKTLCTSESNGNICEHYDISADENSPPSLCIWHLSVDCLLLFTHIIFITFINYILGSLGMLLSVAIFEFVVDLVLYISSILYPFLIGTGFALFACPQ